MAFDLARFLADLAVRPFRYGELDCGLALAELWQAVHGVDGAASLRGTYATEAECAAMLRSQGHLPRLVARLARSVGARQTSDPKPGDFAVIRHQNKWWGAIRTPGGRWAVKCNDGLAALKAPRIVAMWAL